MSATALTVIAFALYLFAAVGYGATLFLNAASAPTRADRAGRLPQSRQAALPLLLAGLLIHFAAIGVLCQTTHRSPFASAFGTLTVLAWVIALSVAALDFRGRLPAVVGVALGVASLVLFWAVLHAHGPVATTPVLAGRIVSLHVLAILASFALFVVAFGCAALYLLQNRLLTRHGVAGLFRRLPPLATLDRIAYRSVAFALPLLTLGLATGIVRVFGGDLPGPASVWFTDPHTLVSLATWLLYATYLTARLGIGWRGVRLQYILLTGPLIVATLYFVPTSTHHFH